MNKPKHAMRIQARVWFMLFTFAISSVWLGVMPRSSCAQTVADSIQRELNPSELRQYRRQRLSVVIETETRRNVEITGNRYYDIWGRQVTRRTVRRSGDTYKTWVPYKGFSRTTEEAFFRTAGYPQLARSARRYHTERVTDHTWFQPFGLVVGGTAAILGGIALGYNATHGADLGGHNFALLGGGLTLSIIGLIDPGAETKTRYIKGPPMRYPASQVHGIAGEYNRNLLNRLRDER